MKRGIIVYDKGDAQYNKWFIEHMIEEGAKCGLEIKLVLTDELITGLAGEMGSTMNTSTVPGEIDSLAVGECDFAIMRNRNYAMSEALEVRGVRCFNSSYVCGIGNDKWEMYQDFSAANIPVMHTQLEKLSYPFVMKPKDGHGGQNVYLVNSEEEYNQILAADCTPNAACNTKAEGGTQLDKYIYQPVASETGRDIRVYIVGGKILAAMERRAGGEGEFRANFSLGGTARVHELTEEEIALVTKTAAYINPDFVGIDIIYNDGKPIINEIEDAVGTRMLYANTNIDAVREYILHIKQQR